MSIHSRAVVKTIGSPARELLRGNPLRVWSVWAPLMLGIVFWWREGLTGFNPTDDGFILAQAWRLVHGEIPHSDFTSPRPVGSALIHLPEVLAPIGMLSISRLVVTFQLLWIAWASINVVIGRRWQLSHLQYFLLLTIAFALNVGTWPIMAWHTIDGLFLGVTALWLVTRKPRSLLMGRMQWIAVWLLAGFAPLTKQGFALVPLLVAGLVWVSGPRRALWYAPLVLLPGLMYVLWTGNAFLDQVYSGSSGELLFPLKASLEAIGSLSGLFAVLAVILAVLLASIAPSHSPWNLVIGGLLVAMPVLLAAHREAFGLAGSWAYISVAVLITVAALTVRRAETAVALISLLGLGFSASMSWGVPSPGLLGGSYLAVALVLFWGRDAALIRQLAALPSSFTFLLLIVVLTALPAMLFARAISTYNELPRVELTATVPHEAFALIRMSPQSATYVKSLRRCLEAYPASQVAVLPDNPGLYPLLGLINPFSSDWWLPPERTIDHNTKVDATVQTLNAEESWLVLFQSYEAYGIRNLTQEQVLAPGPPYAHRQEDLDLLNRLMGEKVTCDSFTGQFKPSSNRKP